MSESPTKGNGSGNGEAADLQAASDLQAHWSINPRWVGIQRPYRALDVIKLRGTMRIVHSFADHGARKLWHLLHDEPYIAALGAQTGGQAVQMVQAGLKAIYVSGWQVAADMNEAMETYPDQSLYPADSVPRLVQRLNKALTRADQVAHVAGLSGHMPDWYVPIVADAEAGFGGVLNAYELMRWMIEAGAAGVHFEDQRSAFKKCGHMGGKVLVPTSRAIQRLVAARLAADVMDVPTVLIARTDADSASLVTDDSDERDRRFIVGDRTDEGFWRTRAGIDQAIDRGVSYAPYADVVWCETSHPDLDEARRFAEGVHAVYPHKLLAYNCSPSFNWSRSLDRDTIARFQRELGAMGYKFQFVTLAGFHALHAAMFELAHGYREEGMLAYARLQDREFELEARLGYRAVKHQSFVGTGYFDQITSIVSGGHTSTTALKGSTEEEQFQEQTPPFDAVERRAVPASM